MIKDILIVPVLLLNYGLWSANRPSRVRLLVKSCLF